MTPDHFCFQEHMFLPEWRLCFRPSFRLLLITHRAHLVGVIIIAFGLWLSFAVFSLIRATEQFKKHHQAK